MSTPVSFAIRPPSRPQSPSTNPSSPTTHSADDSPPSDQNPSSRASSAGPGSGLSMGSFRISTSTSTNAPIRPSPLARGSGGIHGRYNGAGGSRIGHGHGRSAFGRGDDDGEDDDEEGDDSAFRRGGSSRSKHSQSNSKDTAITGFDRNGNAQSGGGPSKPSGPMIIPSLPNRDWRQSSFSRNANSSSASASGAGSRVPTYVPDGGPGRGQVKAEDLVERGGGEEVKGGLQRVERDGDVMMEDVEDVKPRLDTNGNFESAETPQKEETKPLTLEQQALQAVLSSANDSDPTTNPNLTISLQSDTLNLRAGPQPTESDAFRQDVLTRPTESTMDDYASVPIESFGEALLRGMGWNPNAKDGKNPKIHEPKRRPAGLGLGAKEKAGAGAGKEELSRAEKDKKRKEDYATRGGRGYVPVIKRARESHLDLSNSRSDSPSKSRQSSRSPSPRSESSRHRDRERRDREPYTRTESDYSRRGDGYGSDRARVKEREYDSDRGADRAGDRDRDRGGRSGRDREREKEREYDSDRAKGGDRRRERDGERRGYDLAGGRDKGRDREMDRDRRHDDREYDRRR